jgi:hypothetical protein
MVPRLQLLSWHPLFARRVKRSSIPTFLLLSLLLEAPSFCSLSPFPSLAGGGALVVKRGL